MVRRAVGVLLALFGAGAGAAVLTTVTAATVLSVAAGKVASPESAALSGAAGSTTSGSSGGGAVVVSGAAGHAIMTGTPWHVAVIIGALLIFAAGLATALRGQDWPVMSARYDAPGSTRRRPRPRAARPRARRGAPGDATRRPCGSRSTAATDPTRQDDPADAATRR